MCISVSQQKKIFKALSLLGFCVRKWLLSLSLSGGLKANRLGRKFLVRSRSRHVLSQSVERASLNGRIEPFFFLSLDRGHAIGAPAEGAGPAPDAGQDEDGGGAARGLPEAHRGAQGVAHRKGGALQHAADRRECSVVA